MTFEQNKLSKNFVKAAKSMLDNRIVEGQVGLSDAIGFNRTSLNSVLNGKRNIPFEFAKTFQEKFGVQILDSISHNDIQNRLLRIEANLEVFQVAIASLKVKKTGDFEQRFFELQQLIEEAVIRRRSKMESSS